MARFYLSILSCRNPVSHLQSQGGQDVSLFPVGIVQKGDASRAVGVIFDGGHLGRNIQFVPFEIDDPVETLGAAAPIATGGSSLIVSSAAFSQGNQKRSLRDGGGYLLKGGDRPESQ